MLNVKYQNQTTIEQKINDAMLAIPLYDPEWTNFNPADPGITILEVLSAANTLQDATMATIPPDVRRRLFALAGIQPKKSKSAKVLISAEDNRHHLLLPAGQRFSLGGLTYETEKITEVFDSNIIGISSQKKDEDEKDIGYVLDREVKIPAYVFGEKPEAGDSLNLYIDKMPPAGSEMIFYFAFRDNDLRNPVEERNRNMFARIKWEIYTNEGFKEIEARDYTASLLTTGEIRFRMPDVEPAVYVNGKGYLIKGSLTWASYDIAPRLIGAWGFLFEVVQKETKCVAISAAKPRNVKIYSDIAEQGYIRVFAKEEKGSHYHLYTPDYSGTSPRGRYYEELHPGFGQFEFLFDKERFGLGPVRVKNAVRVVCYTEEAMRSYELGYIYGYDNQEFELPYDHIVRGSFCLIAERKTSGGDVIYDFLRPEKKGKGELFYHLRENSGKIIIEDAGDYIGARLLIGSCATTSGPDGNVKPGKRFVASNLSDDILFINPGKGVGGRYAENFNEMKERFQLDVLTTHVAVTASDYENLVSSTPGLCIRRCKAIIDSDENLVRMAVLPEKGINGWRLDETYKTHIMERLEASRMLTTRIELCDAKFVAINVRTKIKVHRGMEDEVEEVAKQFISEQVDYRSADKNFGDILKFDELFRSIERIKGVDCVYELSLKPQNGLFCRKVDDNIIPARDCLCVPGEIEIEIL